MTVKYIIYIIEIVRYDTIR